MASIIRYNSSELHIFKTSGSGKSGLVTGHSMPSLINCHFTLQNLRKLTTIMKMANHRKVNACAFWKYLGYQKSYLSCALLIKCNWIQKPPAFAVTQSSNRVNIFRKFFFVINVNSVSAFYFIQKSHFTPVEAFRKPVISVPL